MMKKSTKLLLAATATAAVGAFAGYKALCYADDLLFKRGMEPSKEFTNKFVECDASHLGEFLENNLQWVEDYGYEKHYLISDSGHRLTAYHMSPEKPSKVFVLAAHGYRSYAKKEFCGVGQYYLEKGINVFMVDHIASGESEGEYCTFGYKEQTDCLKWISYMKEVFGEDIKIILHGVSMGAATVMMMSGSGLLPENVKMTVADCGFTNAAEFFAYRLEELRIPAGALVGAASAVNKKRLGFDFYEISPRDSVRNATVPMLFIHGEDDGLVPCFMAYELYESCGSDKKELLIVEGADHAQSYMVGSQAYTEKLGDFIDSNI